MNGCGGFLDDVDRLETDNPAGFSGGNKPFLLELCLAVIPTNTNGIVIVLIWSSIVLQAIVLLRQRA